MNSLARGEIFFMHKEGDLRNAMKDLGEELIQKQKNDLFLGGKDEDESDDYKRGVGAGILRLFRRMEEEAKEYDKAQKGKEGKDGGEK